MGRRLCTDVSQVCNVLISDWPHLQGFEKRQAIQEVTKVKVQSLT